MPARLSLKVLTSWLGLLCVAAVLPAHADFDRLFQSQKEAGEEWKGYYYYQDPLPDIEVPLHPQQLPPTPAIPLQPEQFADQLALKEALKQLPVEQINLQHLPAAWLKILLTAKKEAALDQQNQDRMVSYLKVHKEAFARSQRFTDEWALAMITNPSLDSTTENPASLVGNDIYSQTKRQEQDALLTSMQDRMGLFFFFTSTCQFCQKQSQLLKIFADTYGLTVKAITQDGRPLPEFPQAVVDNGMGLELGVTRVPVIFLSIPDEQFLVPVSAGLRTLEELRLHVVEVLKKRRGLKSHTLKS